MPRSKWTPEQIEQMRSKLIGRKITWGDKISAAKKGIATSIQKGDKRSPETRAAIKAGFTPEGRQRISEANLGKQLSETHRQTISDTMTVRGRKNFMGGNAGEAFASVLVPVGFEREYRFYYGRGINSYFQIDFAHVEGRVAIELDGPHHFRYTTPIEDQQRDEVLRHFGWKMIRIKHSNEFD